MSIWQAVSDTLLCDRAVPRVIVLKVVLPCFREYEPAKHATHIVDSVYLHCVSEHFKDNHEVSPHTEGQGSMKLQ